MIESFDIETININNRVKPILISLTNDNNLLHFSSLSKNSGKQIAEFFINNARGDGIYYAHNLTFDFLIMLPFFVSLNYSYKTKIFNYMIFSVEIIDKNGKIKLQLRCSYKLTNLSLVSLGKLINLQKKKFPYKLLNSNVFSFKKIYRFHFTTLQEFNEFNELYADFKTTQNLFDMKKILIDYCKRDSLIVKNGVKSFLKVIPLINNKKIPLSASSIALQTAIQFYPKLRGGYSTLYNEIFKMAYYGGRCEVFGNLLPNETALHFDFKGMYSSCMQEKLPLGKAIFVSEPHDFNKPGFYLINFTHFTNIPVLPIKINKKLNFFVGTMEGWFWFEEILLAIKYGAIVNKIIAGLIFDKYEPFLNEYVSLNLSLRDQGFAENIIGKNNINLLYGRLGMEGVDSQFLISNLDAPINFLSSWVMNNSTIYEIKSNKIKPINLAIAAAITSKARIKLYRGFKDVEAFGGRILYSDTDSIIAAFLKNSYRDKLDIELSSGVKFNSVTSGTVLEDAVFALPKAYSVVYRSKDNCLVQQTKIKSLRNLNNFHYKFKDAFLNNKILVWREKSINKYKFDIKYDEIVLKIRLNGLDKRKWINKKYFSRPINYDETSNK